MKTVHIPGVVDGGAVLDGFGVGSVAKHKDKLSYVHKIFCQDKH